MNEQELRLAALDAAVKTGVQSWDLVNKAEQIFRWLRSGLHQSGGMSLDDWYAAKSTGTIKVREEAGK